MSKKKNKTTQAEHLINQGVKMGDMAEALFEETKDLGALKQAVAAYTLARKSSTDQIQYKKLTGKKGKLKFFEG